MRTSEPPDACLELGARKAPRRLFTSWAPLRKTPTGGLLFPAGEELFSVDLELKAIVDPDLTFRATMELSNHRPSRRPRRPFLLGSAASRWRLPGCSSLLLSGGINDGVAESPRRVAIATPRGPPTSPRAAPNAGGFFCIPPRAALFVSKRGNKGAPCRVNSTRAPSTGPANPKKE